MERKNGGIYRCKIAVSCPGYRQINLSTLIITCRSVKLDKIKEWIAERVKEKIPADGSYKGYTLEVIEVKKVRFDALYTME